MSSLGGVLVVRSFFRTAGHCYIVKMNNILPTFSNMWERGLSHNLLHQFESYRIVNFIMLLLSSGVFSG